MQTRLPLQSETVELIDLTKAKVVNGSLRPGVRDARLWRV
jgi:hypothetical protein